MYNEKWTTVIKPKTGWLDINLKELLQYKDLIIMFVKRDFKTLYKQTYNYNVYNCIWQYSKYIN